MKSSVSPAILAVAIVIAVAAIGLMGWKYLGPPSSTASEDLKPVKFDPAALKPGDIEQLRKDLDAAHNSRSGTAGGGENRAVAKNPGTNN